MLNKWNENGIIAAGKEAYLLRRGGLPISAEAGVRKKKHKFGPQVSANFTFHTLHGMLFICWEGPQPVRRNRNESNDRRFSHSGEKEFFQDDTVVEWNCTKAAYSSIWFRSGVTEKGRYKQDKQVCYRSFCFHFGASHFFQQSQPPPPKPTLLDQRDWEQNRQQKLSPTGRKQHRTKGRFFASRGKRLFAKECPVKDANHWK